MPTTATDCWTAIELGCCQLFFAARATGWWLHVVTRAHAFKFGAIEFWPQKPPIIRPQILARDRAARRQLQPNAVFRTRRAIGVGVLPLAQLRVALDRVTERAHTQTQFGYAQRIRRREVLVECHGFESVANGSSIEAVATHCKDRMLRVAHATLMP